MVVWSSAQKKNVDPLVDFVFKERKVRKKKEGEIFALRCLPTTERFEKSNVSGQLFGKTSSNTQTQTIVSETFGESMGNSLIIVWFCLINTLFN